FRQFGAPAERAHAPPLRVNPPLADPDRGGRPDPLAGTIEVGTERVGTKATAVAAAPVAQMENCQRLSSVEKDTSALHKNIAEKGTNAYYFAHSRSYEIPAHAKIITGPGLVAGGPPQKLDGPDGSPAADHGTAPSPQA
ncbi:unnamed protein product, partial [Prorocentrum cordatum]